MEIIEKHNLKLFAEANIPNDFGDFKMMAFAETPNEPMPHLVLYRKLDVTKPVLTRIHSECLTGDLFGSKRCDCGEQLEQSMAMISKEGGVLLYLRQEGRGIGLINKLKAYNLQDEGLNTIDANLHLGFKVDERHYDIAVIMLEHLGIQKIKLLTNNPLKIGAFEQTSVQVVDRIPLIIPPKKENLSYLKTKQDQMGHLYDVDKPLE